MTFLEPILTAHQIQRFASFIALIIYDSSQKHNSVPLPWWP